MVKSVMISTGLVLAALAAFCSARWTEPAARAATSPSPAGGGPVAVAPAPAASEDGVAVYFSPHGGGTAAIVHAIDHAQKTVHVQAAQFTSPPIAQALIAAHGRGVDVRVLLDRDKNKDAKDSQAPRLIDAGIPTFADNRHETAHNKVILVDQRLVVTGSFNFTPDAESKNAENLLLIDGKPKIAAAYEANFREHLAHSKAYKR